MVVARMVKEQPDWAPQWGVGIGGRRADETSCSIDLGEIMEIVGSYEDVAIP